MTDLAEIRIQGGVTVVVPDSIGHLTPYVLREQEQWFESETAFLRHFVQPGMRVIDIGANYGAYTLPLARAAGGDGHVWAVEPTSTTGDCLEKSIHASQLSNVTLIRAALSSRSGTAWMAMQDNPECNRLVQAPGGSCEKVPVRTMDQCATEYGWNRIDLLKLDAEGEEGYIVQSGHAFFANESPLVMFELESSDGLNLPLVKQFGELGYEPYTLVPGLGILVPFSAGEGPVPFQLNLFCCRESRAERLQSAGLLLRNPEPPGPPAERDGMGWLDGLFKLPFAVQMWDEPGTFQTPEFKADADGYMEAVQLFFAAHSGSATANDRYGALLGSFEILRSIADRSNHILRLCMLARVADELGKRGVALTAIQKVLALVQNAGEFVLDVPFLPVCKRFDHVDPEGRFFEWLVASLLEQRERQQAFSSYFLGKESLDALEYIRTLGFPSAELERRRQLIRMRFGMQTGPEAVPILAEAREDNLNRDYWCG